MKSKLIKSLITIGMSLSFLTGCSLLPSGGQNNNNNTNNIEQLINNNTQWSQQLAAQQNLSNQTTLLTQ